MAALQKAFGAVLAGLCLVAAAGGQEDAAPELDFLEYLGSWQDTDEEWLIVEEWDGHDLDEGTKVGEPEHKAPERKDDE